MTKKPGLMGRNKSIKAAMEAAGPGDAKAVSAAKKAKAVPVSSAAAPVLTAAQKFPADPDILRILNERAEIYARPPKSKRTSQGSEAFIQVGLGGFDCYGIPFGYADEIVLAGDITPVPGTPAHISGVVNLRGMLLTVVDLRLFFGLTSVLESEARQIVVVSGDDMRFGILVSRIDGSVQFDSEELSPSVDGTGKSGSNFVRGIHAGKVAVLDLAALIQNPGFKVDQKGT